MSGIAELEEENMRLHAEVLRLSGELATAHERLASYELAEAIEDEACWKRYEDGNGDR